MAFASYANRSYRGNLLVRDNVKGSKWAYRVSVEPSPSPTLEEEIYMLRRKMEQMAIREQCLTAPNVVEISVTLDRKLNEYMQAKQRA